MQGDPSTLALEPREHLSPVPSAVLVYGVFIGLPLVLLALLAIRARAAARAGRLASQKYDPSAALSPGPAVLFGKVEYAPGEDVAVRVEIRQFGSEEVHKGNWKHTWQEVKRTVTVRPFYLVRDDGTKIRIDASDDIQLVDDPARKVQHTSTDRSVIAELDPDEAIYAIGELSPGRDPEQVGGYRGGEMALVLRPPNGGKLLISSKPLDEKYQRRFADSCFFGLGLVAYLILFAIVALGFHARTMFGQKVYGVAEKVERISGKGARCEIEVRLPQGGTLDEDTDPGWCPHIKPGDRVPVIQVGESSWFAQIGWRTTVSGTGVVISLILLILLAIGWAKRGRPWYEAKLVETREGRLS